MRIFPGTALVCANWYFPTQLPQTDGNLSHGQLLEDCVNGNPSKGEGCKLCPAISLRATEHAQECYLLVQSHID